ncbi:ABC-type transport auxiliary lipoprotein family protein [Azorhizobium doebereinerae]|uniref:ABC-type transport auxiliary lipoprotein family protein n=1 Tax=Azorhizobium doebereinerae TaxID=281091 RepID=UPI001FD95FD9|nr:ABC-type transport auxiliary lipoprotein family protein [Azorhizobium doebereinerae]
MAWRARIGHGRAVLSLMLAMTLAGCASAPTPTFDLSAPTGFTARGGSNGQLVVVTPTALAVLDSEKIVVEPAPGQITYLTDAQWSDRLSALLQARTIQAFENGSKMRRVARPGDGVTGDYQLNMDVRSFGVKVLPEGTFAVVEISAKLIATASGRIVAARIFSAHTPLSSVTGPVATAGLDQASNQVLIELVRWASAAQG